MAGFGIRMLTSVAFSDINQAPAVHCLAVCIADVNNWVSASRLRLCLGAGNLLQQIDISDSPVLSSTVRVVQLARDLGVILDSQLSLSAHIAALCRSGFHQLRQIRPAIRSLTPDAARTIVQAFIACHLDWCNSLLYGVSENLLRKVQSVENLSLIHI